MQFRQKYCYLIDELCAACGITRSTSMHEACNLLIGYIPVTLVHGGAMDEESLISFCDFGEPPKENRVSVLQQVLESNMFMLGKKTPHFAINPETGHVLLIAHIPMHNLTSKELLKTLSMHALAARQWRMTHSVPIANETATLAPPTVPNTSPASA
jgi:hypothetical protein